MGTTGWAAVLMVDTFMAAKAGMGMEGIKEASATAIAILAKVEAGTDGAEANWLLER